jgi:16S rRNA (cytosine967-C5)-methyltransferase
MSPDTIGSERLRGAHLRASAEVFAEILRGEKPADVLLRERFAQQRSAGARDRAAITNLVYGVLRNFFPLRAALGDTAAPLDLCAAQALQMTGDLPALQELDATDLRRRLENFDERTLDDATRHNLPSWLWRALSAQYGAEAAALADALNTPATVDLRVNTLKATRDAAQVVLAEDGIAATPIGGVAAGVRLGKRVALQRTRAFRDGLVEPQDEGSQRLAEFVGAKPGERIADFCAGGGGKTLALGAAMRNRGELHAFDVSRARLARLAPRLQRSGLTIVTQTVLRDGQDARLGSLAGTFDAVLVDAPCSATGTLRRNPELRLREPDLGALARQQRSILEAAARLVRPDGRLVYATCSVLREENEAVAEGFLAAHAEFRADGEPLVLLPHRDGTDGFYAARLIRAGAAV